MVLLDPATAQVTFETRSGYLLSFLKELQPIMQAAEGVIVPYEETEQKITTEGRLGTRRRWEEDIAVNARRRAESMELFYQQLQHLVDKRRKANRENL